MGKTTKKGEEKTRSQGVYVRMTTDEYQKVKELSETLGVSIAEIFRSKVFRGEFPEFRRERLEKICEHLPVLIREVNRIGVNVNQIARYCNRGRVVDYQVLRQLEEINEELSSLLLLVVKLFEECGRADKPSAIQE